VAAHGIDQSHAIRSPEANARFLRHVDNGLLQGAAFRSDFGKTARFDHHTGHALADAVRDRLRHGFRRNKDDGQIHRVRNGAYCRVAGQPLDFIIAGVDGADPPSVARDQVFQDRESAFEGVRGCPHHGDRLRIEEEVHRVLLWHCGQPNTGTIARSSLDCRHFMSEGR